jgi:hypothetical protein
MAQILYVNPKKKKAKKRPAAKKKKTSTRAKPTKKGVKKAPKKGAKKMASKKGKKPGPKPKRNPAKKRGGARKAAKTIAKRSITGLNFKSAAKNMLPTQLGMFCAKWGAKKFPGFGGDAEEGNPDSWGYQSFIKGALGATVGAMVINAIRPSYGQKVLEGGLNLMMYELFQMKLISRSEWASGQFGEEEDYIPDEYLLTGSDDYPQVMGEDGNWYPANEVHRLPETTIGQAELVRPGALGDNLQPPGALGGDPWARLATGV